MGIIELSDSPYICPIIPVMKKDGTLRLCVAYRRPNQVTMVQQELMPNPEDMFAKLPKAKFSSKLTSLVDTGKSKWMRLRKKYTAFSSPVGSLQWTRHTFVLASASSIFTKLMRKLTWGRQDTVSCLADVLLFHTNLDDHIRGLKSMLDTIRKFGLAIRPSTTLWRPKK